MNKKITRKSYQRILINRKIETDKGNQLTRGNITAGCRKLEVRRTEVKICSWKNRKLKKGKRGPCRKVPYNDSKRLQHRRTG